jgi:hypothetical protein
MVRADAEKAAQTLRAVEGVVDVQIVDSVNVGYREQPSPSLIVNMADDARERLCVALVGAGIGVLELRSERELEGVFVKLARAAPQPAAAPGKKAAGQAAEAS